MPVTFVSAIYCVDCGGVWMREDICWGGGGRKKEQNREGN